jgi:putative endonuclease
MINKGLVNGGFFMYYIYLLYSEASDVYYVGYTSDVDRRLLEHNTSERETYTSKHRPWTLKAVFACGEDEGEAKRIETFIKKQKSRKFLERMIVGEALYGGLAQLVRVPYVRH